MSGFDPGVGGYEEEQKPNFFDPPAQAAPDPDPVAEPDPIYGLNSGGADAGGYESPAPSEPEPRYPTGPQYVEPEPDYGLNAGGEDYDPNYGIPASEYGTYQATAPQTQYVDEWGGNDPGQNTVEPSWNDEWAGNDPGQAAPVAAPDWNPDFGLNGGDEGGEATGPAPDWNPNFGLNAGETTSVGPQVAGAGTWVDEFGGNDPGQRGTFSPDHGQYDNLEWTDQNYIYDQEKSGQAFFGTQRQYKDPNNGMTYDWDPAARPPSLTIQAWLNGQLDPLQLTPDQQREIVQWQNDGPQESLNWWYTQQQNKVAAGAYNQAQSGTDYQQQYLRNNSDRLRYNEAVDQANTYVGFSTHLGEQNDVVDNNYYGGPAADPTLWEGPNGRDGRSGSANNQVRAGSDFDRYAAIIQQGGTGFEQATAGLTQAERLNLFAAGQNINDPQKLAEIRQQWIDAHVYNQQNNRNYLSNPTSALDNSVADIGNNAIGGYNAGMEQFGRVIAAADERLNRIPGVKPFSDNSYAFVQRALAIPPDQIKISTGPIGSGLGALTDLSHEAMIQAAGTFILERQQAQAGVREIDRQVGVQERRQAGQAWADANPEIAGVLEGVVNAGVTWGAGKFVPKGIGRVADRFAPEIRTEGDWTTGRLPAGTRAAAPFDPAPRTPTNTRPYSVDPVMPADIRGRVQSGFQDGRQAIQNEPMPRPYDFGGIQAAQDNRFGHFGPDYPNEVLPPPSAVDRVPADPALEGKPAFNFSDPNESSLPTQRNRGPVVDAPQVAHDPSVTPRPDVPQIPGVMRGSEYAQHVADNGMPSRVQPRDHHFDEGEPGLDLEGERTADLEGEQFDPPATGLRDQIRLIPQAQRTAREEAVIARANQRSGASEVPDGPRFGGRVESGADIAPQYQRVPDRTNVRGSENIPYEISAQRGDFGQARTSAMPGETRAQYRERLSDDFSDVFPTDESAAFADKQNARMDEVLGRRYGKDGQQWDEGLSPVNRAPEIEAAYENAVDKVKQFDKTGKAQKIQARLNEIVRFGPPDEAGNFPMIGGRLKELTDRADAMKSVRQADRPEYKQIRGEIVRLQQERKDLYQQIPKARREELKSLVQDVDALQYQYDRTPAGRTRLQAGKFDTESEVWDQQFQVDDDLHEPRAATKREIQYQEDANVGPDPYAGEMYIKQPEDYGPAAEKHYENRLENQMADEAYFKRGGPVPPHKIQQLPEGVAGSPHAMRTNSPSAGDAPSSLGVKSGEAFVPVGRPGSVPRANGYERVQPRTENIQPKVGEGVQTVGARAAVEKAVAADRLSQSPLYRSVQSERKTIGQLLQQAKSAGSAATKTNSIMGALPMSSALTVNEDDTDGMKLFKYGVATIGAVASGYALIKHPKLLGRKAGPGVRDLPDLSVSDKRFRLPKDTQRLRVTTASKGYLQTHLQPEWEKLQAGKIDRGQFNTRVQQLIDQGGAGKAATYNQTVLDQQMKNLWQYEKLGEEVKKKVPLAINGANNTFQGFLEQMVGHIDDALVDGKRIGRTYGRDEKGRVTWASPLEKGTQLLARPFHEVFLQHSPPWLAEQVVDGTLQKTFSATFDQMGMQFEKGAAGRVKAGMGQEGTGWPHSEYISSGRFSDISHLDEPTIFGKSPVAKRIRAAAEAVEKDAKTQIYANEASGYLNTAMARELGTEGKESLLKFVEFNNNPFWGVEEGRLAGLPADVKADLKGVVDRSEVNQIARDRLKAGDITSKQARDLQDIFDSHQADAHKYGVGETTSRMRDYSQKTNLDLMLGAAAPLHYWTTHNFAFMARVAAKHPAGAIAILAAAAWTMDQNKDQPTYLKMSAKVPIRELANKLPADQKQAVNDAMDQTFGKGQDLRLNLWSYANPFIADVVKLVDSGDVKKLKETFGSASTAQQLAKLANSFGYHAGPMYDIFSSFVQQGNSPSWLDKLTATPYQGRNFTGSAGKFISDIGELTPAADLLHGISKRLYGNDLSALDEQGVKDRGGDRLAYFQAKTAQDGLYLLGARNTTGSDEKKTDERSKQEKVAKGPALVTEQYPQPYEPETPKGKRQQAFFQEHPTPKTADGKDMVDGSPAMVEYWKKYGEEYRQKIEGEGNPDFGNALGTKGLLVGASSGGTLEDRAIKGTQKTPDGESYLPNQRGTSNIQQQLNLALQQAGNDKEKKTAQDKTAIAYVWDWYMNQPMSDGAATPYEYNKKWGDSGSGQMPEGYDPTKGRYAIPPPKLGAGQVAGANDVAKPIDASIKASISSIMDELDNVYAKSGGAAAKAWYDTPVVKGGPTRREFVARWKSSVDKPDLPATAPFTNSTPAANKSQAAPSTGVTSKPNASGSAWIPNKYGTPSTSVKSSPKPTTRSSPAYATPASRSTSSYGATTNRSVTPSRSTVTPSSKTTSSRASEYYDFLPKVGSGSGSRGSGSPVATRNTTTALARETATRYNDWQTKADAGKTTLSEAESIIQKHASQGGDPTPYVKRAQYTLYQKVKAYSGPTRAAGDADRGRWFKEIKALPTDLKGLKEMVRIEKEIDAKKAAGQAKAGASTIQRTT